MLTYPQYFVKNVILIFLPLVDLFFWRRQHPTYIMFKSSNRKFSSKKILETVAKWFLPSPKTQGQVSAHAMKVIRSLCKLQTLRSPQLYLHQVPKKILLSSIESLRCPRPGQKVTTRSPQGHQKVTKRSSSGSYRLNVQLIMASKILTDTTKW